MRLPEALPLLPFSYAKYHVCDSNVGCGYARGMHTLGITQ